MARPAPDPGVGQRTSAWEWVERASWIFAIFGTLVVLVALGLTYAEISDVKALVGHVEALISETDHIGKVSATVTYDVRYKSADIQKYVDVINEKWGSSEGKQTTWKGSPQQRASFVKSNQNKTEFEDAVLSVADFYEDLYVCLSNQACDLDLTYSLLAQEIRSFYIWNHNYLEAWHHNAACVMKALYEPANAYLSSGALPQSAPGISLARTPCPKL